MITQSSRLALERAGIIPTYRRPESVIAFRNDRVKTQTIPDPFPLEPLYENGPYSSDRIGILGPWPHGYINETESSPS